jgi:CsoR family transcriptional regulator, copper-sensing transcriptional repressor
MLDGEVKAKILNRLSRVEGQVRGIAKMVEDDRYCIDILNQMAAIKAALAKVEGRLLQNHLEHCIEDSIIAGDKKEQRRKAAELIELLERAK